MASMGRWVADSPMRAGGRAVRASSRSRDSARWAPRLLGARAWISSMMTVRTVSNMALPEALLNKRYRDSGVVTRMWGGARRMRSRSP